MISDEPINRSLLAADWASSYLYAPVISSPRHLRSPPNTRCGKLCGKHVENRGLKSQIRAFRKYLQREEAREITLLVRLTDKQVSGFGLVLRTKPTPSCFVLFCFRLLPPFADGLTEPKTNGFVLGFRNMLLHLPSCGIFRSLVLSRSAALATVRALLTEIERVFLHSNALQVAVFIAFQELQID